MLTVLLFTERKKSCFLFKDGKKAAIISQWERPDVMKSFVITAHISLICLIIVQKAFLFRTPLAVVKCWKLFVSQVSVVNFQFNLFSDFFLFYRYKLYNLDVNGNFYQKQILNQRTATWAWQQNKIQQPLQINCNKNHDLFRNTKFTSKEDNNNLNVSALMPITPYGKRTTKRLFLFRQNVHLKVWTTHENGS